jgi:hypothetical protein
MHTSWTPELVAALAEPFPRELHTNKHNRGTFVSVRHYVARLNELVGPQGWSMDAPVAFHAGNKLCLGVGVTILGVTKWNVGDEQEDHGDPIEYTDPNSGEVKEKVVDFGSSSTNSWAQAFKRCLAYGFGLGLYLYDKDFTKQYLASRAAPKQTPEQARSEEWEAALALCEKPEDFTYLINQTQSDAEKRRLAQIAWVAGYEFDKESGTFRARAS